MNSCKPLIITEPGSRRHGLITAHLEEKGFSALVSSAVFLESSDEFPCEYDQQTRNRLLGYDLTIGEIGCFMAHRKAWKQVVLLDRACLILEDDARVRPTFSPAALQEIADAIAGKKLSLDYLAKDILRQRSGGCSPPACKSCGLPNRGIPPSPTCSIRRQPQLCYRAPPAFGRPSTIISIVSRTTLAWSCMSCPNWSAMMTKATPSSVLASSHRSPGISRRGGNGFVSAGTS